MRNSNTASPLGLLFSTTTALVSPAHEAIAQRPLYQAIPPLTVRDTAASMFRRLTTLIDIWYRRTEQRQQLGQLNEHLLNDIGLEPFDVARERKKAFWQA
jgi:uncharacterized protein YjiS (DUF1127 family)